MITICVTLSDYKLYKILMEKQRSPFTLNSPPGKKKFTAKKSLTTGTVLTPSLNSIKPSGKSINESKNPSKPIKKARGYSITPSSSSGTQYFRRQRHSDTFEKITSDQYVGLPQSMSGSSSFHCVHGPDGKLYTDKELLQRNLLKELDPILYDRNWTENCSLNQTWEVARKLEFLVTDPMALIQDQRIADHLLDLAKISCRGFIIEYLPSVTVVVNYLVETYKKKTELRDLLIMLLTNMEKPVLLNAASDVVTYFGNFRSWVGYLGYLLIRLEDDDLFSLVSNAVIWQLSAPDSVRGADSARLRHIRPAAGPVLYETAVRMLAVTDNFRFSTFLEIALILACDNADNCLEMMKENIIENIFYRFNPYFPERKLPVYDISPADPQDFKVKLGVSSLNMSTTLSLLLILVKTTTEYLNKTPECRLTLPCPDAYSQRCFIWAYRYECRAREHQNERITLTVIITALLNCFGSRLSEFSVLLMPDVMSMSVLTEVSQSKGWISSVKFNTSQLDVTFKKNLINLSVHLLQTFPYNTFMIESQHWLLGLMYLIDPGLCSLRTKWSPSLFAELRKTTMQALVFVSPLMPPQLSKQYGLIRRIMWYIEWYSESPYELLTLYWCVRLLQVIVDSSFEKDQLCDVQALFDTHGVIIIIHLCYTLLEQKTPPVERGQIIISMCLRVITRAIVVTKRLNCCVYPAIKWPTCINGLANKMIDVVLFSLDKNFIISDRWLVALLDFIWEGIIWKAEFRANFIAGNGVYKLLDIITMTRPSVQCIALGMVCDVARAGDAVGQLVTWRSSIGASRANPMLVKRGATIAALLTAIFRDECLRTGIPLDVKGIIQKLDYPLMSATIREAINDPEFLENKSSRTSVCLAAGDLAGSRLSKVFALLHMLSDDLKYQVSLADEAYNMYKNIKLAPEDEAILVLCSHYFTLKLNDVWLEIKLQSQDLLPFDSETLEEFLQIGIGWAKEIKRQQEDVIRNDKKKEQEEECSLYTFLARARLNIALDALREVRCVARSSDRGRMTLTLIHDAVSAHHRRSVIAKKLEAPVLKTYDPSLDNQNITSQFVKVHSIKPKGKLKPRELSSSS